MFKKTIPAEGTGGIEEVLFGLIRGLIIAAVIIIGTTAMWGV